MSSDRSVEISFRRAVANIGKFGDTDIFPFPVENKILKEKEEDIVSLLCDIDRDLDRYLESIPLVHDRVLASAGYSGFRAASQIDSIWNAYLLGITIHLGVDIESQRIGKEHQVVHSYRFLDDPGNPQLFEREYGWGTFHSKSAELARGSEFVIVSDISDFYPRIYHHRLENALKKCSEKRDYVKKVIRLVKALSVGNVSYGLPVGGPAARLLSELVLNNVDRLLRANGIQFCRFVDDYRIFAETREEAFSHLVFLAQKLLDNEGMMLQKTKTRIMTSNEYIATSSYESEADEVEEREVKSFLSLNVHFDPYSVTAEDDYRELQEELRRFDIVGMLSKEVRKTRVHESLVKKLLRSIRHLNDRQKDAAIQTLCENIHVLSPVYPIVVILIISLLQEMSDRTRDLCFTTVCDLVRGNSHITQVPVNMAFSVRLLSHLKTEESDGILQAVYTATNSEIVKREVIISMTKHDSVYWISDLRRNYATLTNWEKRALLIASYILEDEGSEWRKRVSQSVNEFDRIVLAWASDKKQNATLLEEL